MPPAQQSTTWTAIRLAPIDTVATALSPLASDTTPRISGGGPGGDDAAAPTVLEAIPRGHKFALTDIRASRPSSNMVRQSASQPEIFAPAPTSTSTISKVSRARTRTERGR